MNTLIEKAKTDAFNTIQMCQQRGYSEYSLIHRCSNECLRGICNLFDMYGKRITTSCGSGDPYLSFVLNGASEVINFDINGLTEYNLILKIIGNLIISPDEFKEFFVFGRDKMKIPVFGRTGFFDEKIYSKMQQYLPEHISTYWDILYSNIPGDLKSDTLKVFKIHYISSIMQNISYLDVENYDKLRRILEKRKLPSFYKLDMFSIAEMLTGESDLIYLSNISEYVPDFDKWLRYCLNDLKTLLSKDGKIMTYKSDKDYQSMELIASEFEEKIIPIVNGQDYIYTYGGKNGNRI